MSTQYTIETEPRMRQLGEQFAKTLKPGDIVLLSGTLGAGKTTLTKGLLAGLGYTGLVKSPTFTLVEPYLDGKIPVYHFDLYRLEDLEELEYIGWRDYLAQDNILIIEWPERIEGRLPGKRVLRIRIEQQDLAVRMVFVEDFR